MAIDLISLSIKGGSREPESVTADHIPGLIDASRAARDVAEETGRGRLSAVAIQHPRGWLAHERESTDPSCLITCALRDRLDGRGGRGRAGGKVHSSRAAIDTGREG